MHLSGYLISGDDFFNEEIEEEEVSQIAEKKRPKKEAVDGRKKLVFWLVLCLNIAVYSSHQKV